MSNDVMTEKDEAINLFLNAMERMIKGIGNLRKRNRPLLNGERYLTDEELSKRLKVNRRTLQDYRTSGKIPYIKLGGKILYRETDVEKLLQSNYHTVSGI